MRNIDLMNYLSQFPDESELSVVIANPDKDVREIYSVKDFVLANRETYSYPCFIIGVGKSKPLNDE